MPYVPKAKLYPTKERRTMSSSREWAKLLRMKMYLDSLEKDVQRVGDKLSSFLEKRRSEKEKEPCLGKLLREAHEEPEEEKLEQVVDEGKFESSFDLNKEFEEEKGPCCDEPLNVEERRTCFDKPLEESFVDVVEEGERRQEEGPTRFDVPCVFVDYGDEEIFELNENEEELISHASLEIMDCDISHSCLQLESSYSSSSMDLRMSMYEKYLSPYLAAPLSSPFMHRNPHKISLPFHNPSKLHKPKDPSPKNPPQMSILSNPLFEVDTHGDETLENEPPSHQISPCSYHTSFLNPLFELEINENELPKVESLPCLGELNESSKCGPFEMSCDEYIGVFNKLMGAQDHGSKSSFPTTPFIFSNSYMFKKLGVLSTLFFSLSSLRQAPSKPWYVLGLMFKALAKKFPRGKLVP